MIEVLVVSNQLGNSGSNPVVRNTILATGKNRVNYTELPVKVGRFGPFGYCLLLYDLLLLKFFSRNYAPDVVHVHFGGIQALITALFYFDRLVISFHGTDLHGGTPLSKRGKIKSLVGVFCSRLASNLCNQVTLVSESLRQFLTTRAKSKAIVIPTGVDFSIFYPRQSTLCKEKLGLDMDKKYILFSDISHSPVKRRDIALEVMHNLQSIDSKYELLFLSKVDYEVVPLYLNASSAVLIVSDKEGSPNIVKEALACKVPIFSFDVGDVREYISKEPSCSILGRGCSKEAAATIDEIVRSDAPHIDVDFWRKRISLSIIADKYCQLYRKITDDSLECCK